MVDNEADAKKDKRLNVTVVRLLVNLLLSLNPESIDSLPPPPPLPASLVESWDAHEDHVTKTSPWKRSFDRRSQCLCNETQSLFMFPLTALKH